MYKTVFISDIVLCMLFREFVHLLNKYDFNGQFPKCKTRYKNTWSILI